jgi:hypothetical protein
MNYELEDSGAHIISVHLPRFNVHIIVQTGTIQVFNKATNLVTERNLSIIKHV